VTTVRAADVPLFARDFDSVDAGASFASRGRTVTEADIVAFSALTGDWHPQHSDATWAAKSRFGERVAHGMLVLSFALGLVDHEPDRVIALRAVTKATFKAPVKIGDTIRVDGTVTGTKPLDGSAGLVETRWRVLNQHGRVVAVLGLQLLWRRGAGPDAWGVTDMQ
jgi:3-hydroxybutyryl-CoA dehydratase